MTGGRQRRTRAAAMHISSLGDDLLLEIFLRLHSLATLVRAACTCPAWRRAVASSPAFRRRFRALHPAPLLGLFSYDEYSDRSRLPAFMPADSRGDADVLAALRGGDFGLASLDAQEIREGELEPRRWLVSECREGYVLLVNWDASLLAVVNPISPRRMDYIPLPYVEHNDITDGYRGHVKGFREVNFRLVHLCHDVSRVRAAVFSSATWDWRVLPWTEVAARAPEDDEWLEPGTQTSGVLCWRIREEERVLILDTNTMDFSVYELPQPCLSQPCMDLQLDLDGVQLVSHSIVIGVTENGGDLCIVRDTAFSIDVLTRRADHDGVEKWLLDSSVLNWAEPALFENYGRQDLLAINDGFLYLVTAEKVLSLCLETMQMETLFMMPSDHQSSVARLYPYFMAWPPSLVGNYGRFAELQDDAGNA